MKRLSLSFFLTILAVSNLWAVPAHPDSARVVQPDGSFVTLRLVGDEFHHFLTTTDGYTVLGTEGGYVYAKFDDEGMPHATTLLAHDAPVRSVDEQKLLRSLHRNQHPMPSEASRQLRAQESARRLQAPGRQKLGLGYSYDYNNFRGMVLLVEYNDCSFSRSDYAELVNDMVNKQGYTGFEKANGKWDYFTGSVRDYFYDNSNQQFDPQFDIVGPVQIDESQFIHEADASTMEVNTSYLRVISKAIDAADELVDYRNYDGDNDGIVDMVYVIFAGAGSNYTGNDERLIWPHAGEVYEVTDKGIGYKRSEDGVGFGRYACSTEFYASPDLNILDGIGTICHEFSHVLGLPDFYDTDYEQSGGESHHPDLWSVMSGGSYANNSRSPVGYGLYERWNAGFTEPVTISEPGSYTLERLDNSNTGFRLASGSKNEYFLLENRQQFHSKWDKYLPGHGMLVFRVDETNKYVWQSNTINCNPKHNYYELLRAGNVKTGSVASDPFPGTTNRTSLNNVTKPSLLSWSGKEAPQVIEHIAESQNVITFDLTEPVYDRTNWEDFEELALTSPSVTDTTSVAGRIGLWTLTGGAYIADAKGLADDNQALAMVKNSNAFVSTSKPVKSVTFNLFNPTDTRTMPYFYVSEDSLTWTQLRVSNTEAGSGIKAGESGMMTIEPNHSKPSYIRIWLRIGDSSSPVYLDNFQFELDESYDPGSAISSPAVSHTLGMDSPYSYNLMGQRVNGHNVRGILIRNGKKFVIK
ncbi:MAG: M6 family metalloprotease domain-containing protein [Prevotella sp.]|nr:M6 family metalloprotease domain-containing protein [Prevotella sp.]